jgi:F-type H+-transporting ATPase subunit c
MGLWSFLNLPALAEAMFPEFGRFGIALGAGLVVIGAARGIGSIGSKAVESMARQPEVKGNIFTSMIISAALIEGFTFFALVVCMMGLAKQ